MGGRGPRAGPALRVRRALLAVAALGADGQQVTFCRQQCSFDSARTQECHVSKGYASALVDAFAKGGPWAALLAKQASCESNCSRTAACETDQAGKCAASRSWVVSQLLRPEADGGAGIDASSCGLLGLLLARGAGCSTSNDEEDCGAQDKSAGLGCEWDRLRDVCDVARQDILSVLRSDFRDELARVSLRRARCDALGSTPSSCSGDCIMAQGRCVLRPLDSLLAISGEDCPLRVLFQDNAGCSTSATRSSCRSQLRSDGLQKCEWRDGQCEADPIALEFDLLLMVGLGKPQVLDAMRTAEQSCLRMSTPGACQSVCAPLISWGAAAGGPRPAWALWAALALAALLWQPPSP